MTESFHSTSLNIQETKQLLLKIKLPKEIFLFSRTDNAFENDKMRTQLQMYTFYCQSMCKYQIFMVL